MGTSGAGYVSRLKDVLRRVHPDDRRPLIHAFRDCLQSGKTSQWEFRVRNGDGREWVTWIDRYLARRRVWLVNYAECQNLFADESCQRITRSASRKPSWLFLDCGVVAV